MVFRILDASAFYAGVPFGSKEQYYTTSFVFDEIKHIKKDHGALDALLDLKKLVIRDPQKQFIDLVVQSAKKTGDHSELSEADVSAIALCLELKGELVSDDYAVSNVAASVKLKVISVMTGGISNAGSWIFYCPACKKNFSNIIECPVCGSKLRKKLLKGKSSSIPVNK